MAISKIDFFIKYNISDEDFEKSTCDFEELQKIHEDFSKKFQRYDDAGANLVRILLRFNSVHSVKYRIKDPEHLIEKIIRKKIKNSKLDIKVNNYQQKIQDLIGIRILHLFKSDWLYIHTALNENFKQVEKPEANIRKGDADIVFKENGCKIKVHPAGYRSVHYLVKTEPTVEPYIAEIQVRTIFEEAWSEIDHKVRYPYFTEHEIINQYLRIFNRLAGSADEMGDFVSMLKANAIANQKNIDELENLKKQIKESSLAKAEKETINKSLESITFKPNDLTEIFRKAESLSKLTSGTQAYMDVINKITKDAALYKKIIPPKYPVLTDDKK